MSLRIKIASLFAVLAVTAASTANAYDIKNVALYSNPDEFIKYNDVWGYTTPGGDDYAIIGTKWGTAFYNAVDPENPFLVGFVGGPESVWRDMKTYSHYCYITTEGIGTDEGLQVVDLADPENPVLVNTYTASFTSAHNLHIDTVTAHAYVCGASGGTHILSLADPVNPVRVGGIASPYVHDLVAKDSVLYVGAIGSGQLRIYDITNPASPSLISSVTTPGNACHNAWPSEDDQWVFTSDETFNGYVNVWDISNINSIQWVADYQVGPIGSSVHNTHILGNIAHISYYTEGMRFLDITNPASPVELGYYDTHLVQGSTGYNGNWGIFPYSANGAIYGSDFGTGLLLVELLPGNGNVSGTVTDGSSTDPIEDVTIEISSTGFWQQSSRDGDFSIHESPGVHTITFTRYGYATESIVVDVTAGLDTTVAIVMTPLPKGSITGTVTDDLSDPIDGAYVELIGVEGLKWTHYSDTTDASGTYTISDVPIGAWELSVERIGQTTARGFAHVTDGATATADIGMSPAIFWDDFETNKGWTFGAPGDDATEGIFERAAVVGKESGWVVPSRDHTVNDSGNKALLTGQGVVFNPLQDDEVDGTTSVISPSFNLSSATDPVITFYRAFSVNSWTNPYDGDSFVISISNDNGSSWVTVDSTVTNHTGIGRQWRHFEFAPADHVSLTGQMRVKFKVTDQGGESVVEASIDDFSVHESTQSYVGVASGDGEAPVRSGARLAGNTPNPFNPTTSILFELDAPARVDLEVYDLSGRLVRVLAADRYAAGTHEVAWDGRDETGLTAGSGVYFYRLRSGNTAETRKMLLVK